jgi:hypothetical protein
MMRLQRMTGLRFRFSVFGFQKCGVAQHGVLSAERCRSFRVIRVFRGCTAGVHVPSKSAFSFHSRRIINDKTRPA